MGLLDDAIREHLELKRRHGADAGEVARLEHDALGPVRREDIAIRDPGPPPGLQGEAAGALPGEEPTALLPATPASAAGPAAEVPPPPDVPGAGQPTVAFSLEDLEAGEGTPVPPGPAARPEPEPPVQDLAWDAPAAAADDPPPPAQPAPVAPDVVPADDEPGEHDELEETPDFLQETPEHDRLWFEQKPPRDFDF